MLHTLKLVIGLLALLALPALSACDTDRGMEEDAAVGEARSGTDAVGEEGTTGEATSGTMQDEEEGTSGEAGEGAQGTTQ